MPELVSTYIIDDDKTFTDLVIKAIKRTENLNFSGCTSSLEYFKEMCGRTIPSLVLINIDLHNTDPRKFSEYLRAHFLKVFIVLMNLDGKKFGSDKPATDIADGYLEKDSLFQEIQKISKYFNEKPELNKNYNYNLSASSINTINNK